MALGKWIGGFLGFVGGGGVLGALAGFCLGALFDKALDAVNTPGSQPKDGVHSAFGQNESYAYTGHNQQRRQEEGERNSFFFSLLVLASYIINVDGKVMHSEMEYVRNFLRSNWGEAAKEQGNEILKKLFRKQTEIGFASFHETIVEACLQIRSNMGYVVRLQLFHFLYEIACADGVVSQEEEQALLEVGRLLALSEADIMSMIGRSGYGGSGHQSGYNGSGSGYRSAASGVDGSELAKAYRTLGISSSATDDEVRRAYRHLVLLYHSDKLAEGASDEKIKEINAAKEIVYKSRNM
ncbi:MAG: TerB family tellurite resistance protein [Prevotella sp.]|nr:TerB family tellurite resistance protein [Bacteroidales bacterium]MDY4229726.1 TerB family tellurite resistance protein [Prevotella sp.]